MFGKVMMIQAILLMAVSTVVLAGVLKEDETRIGDGSLDAALVEPRDGYYKKPGMLHNRNTW